MRKFQRFIYLPLLCASVWLAVAKIYEGSENGNDESESVGVRDTANGEECDTIRRSVGSRSTVTIAIEGHNYIDLGLKSGTLWAECNVGAENAWEYGDYFAWGETDVKCAYTVYDSKWYGVSYSSLEGCGVVDCIGNLTPDNDAARMQWGECWRTPTLEEMRELVSLKSEVAVVNGVRGRRFKGANGASLFLPFSGCRLGGERNYVGLRGDYWSATASENEWRAGCFRITSQDAWMRSDYRYYLFSVRAVVSKR